MYSGNKTDSSAVIAVCSFCNKILENGHSASIAEYLENYMVTAYNISYGLCPDCLLEHYPKEYLDIQKVNRIRIRKKYPAAGFYLKLQG